MSDHVIFQRVVDGVQNPPATGLWWISRAANGQRPCVSVLCPRCGACQTIKDRHGGATIAADGTVAGVVACTNVVDAEGSVCNFSDLIALGGWGPQPEWPNG